MWDGKIRLHIIVQMLDCRTSNSIYELNDFFEFHQNIRRFFGIERIKKLQTSLF